MVMPATRFAVAIPTWNRRETVLLTVESVLRQTRPAEEIYVLCDGCTDGTQEALAALGEPRLQVLDLPKAAGYAYAHRDLPVERSSADAIMWMGDDDLLMPDYLERAGAVWDAGDVDFVVSPAAIVWPDDTLEWVGRDLTIPSHRTWFDEVGCTLIMGSATVRRTLVQEVGGWDASIPRAGDYELWQRMLARGARLGWQPEPTLLHFKATGRVQAWPDRVVQNTRWAQQLREPGGVAAVRAKLQEARAAWPALLTDQLRQRVRIEEQLQREAQVLRANAERAEAALAAAQDRLAQAERDRAVLQSIYDGGWWRLRGRIRRLLLRRDG